MEQITSSRQPALDIVVCWGDSVIDALRTHESRGISIGPRTTARHHDLEVEIDLPSFVIAERCGTIAQITIPEVCCDELVVSGLSSTVELTDADAPFPARCCLISLGQSLRFRIGPLTFEIRFDPQPQEAIERPAINWRFPLIFTMVSMVHSALWVAMMRSPPPRQELYFRPQTRFAAFQLRPRKKIEIRSFARFSASEGKFGKRDRKKSFDSNQVSNIFGPAGLGTGALGGLRGTARGDAHGAGGLGTRGTGIGGGGLGSSVGLGGLTIPPSRFSKRSVNPTVSTSEDNHSTFAIDVDTASYSIVRRALLEGRVPNPSEVRVEEMINYFRYDYHQPAESLFSIQADGARSPVDERKHLLRVGIQASVPAQRQPVNLVFLVDTSGSMQFRDKLALAKQSMLIALRQLTKKDQVAITTYAGNVSRVLPPTNGDRKGVIKRAIRNLVSSGGTAMESGLTLAYQQAVRMVGDGSTTRVIVLSDGDANIGATSHEAMLDRIRGYVEEGVRMSTIGFGTENYQDVVMEQLANKGNGNYFYIDSERMAERVFGRDFTKMAQDVAQDVKIQVEFNPEVVESYRLVGYENRDIADEDFRNDRVDAGEIGAGHQVTALYELTMKPDAGPDVATIRVRAKKPRGMRAKEVGLEVPVSVVHRPFWKAPDDLRFATAVMGGAELLRRSPYRKGWSFDRVISMAAEATAADPDRRAFVQLMKRAARIR